MPTKPKAQITASKRAHRSTAAGTAQTKARPKLRRGSGAEQSGSDRDPDKSSSMATALTIMTRSLPLLDSLGQRHVAAVTRHKADASRQVPMRKMVRGKWLRAWDEIITFVQVPGLLRDEADLEAPRSGAPVIRLPAPHSAWSGHPFRTSLASRLVLPVVCALFPGQAFAQAIEPAPLTPIDLFLPENSQGVRVAPSLILQSTIEASIAHDTNIYNRELNPRADTIAVVRPTLHLGTDWSRHALEVEAGAEVQRYFETSSENSEQWNLKGKVRFDLGQRLTLNAGAGLARKVEPRGSVGDIFGTDRPVRLMEKYANFEIARTGGRLELIAGGSITKFSFAEASLNGAPIDLGFRDVVVRQAHVRTNFALSPRIGVFADLSGNQIDYSRDIGAPRNSNGFGVLGGIHYQISALVDVEAAVGLISQSFEDPLVPRTNGLNFALSASWTPTSRWKLVAGGHRTVDPSPALGVPAIVRSDLSLTAQYAVSDKILFEAGGAFVREDFRGFPRSDDQFLANVAVHYRLTDRLMASAKAGHRQRSSSVPGQSYDGWHLGLSLKATL